MNSIPDLMVVRRECSGLATAPPRGLATAPLSGLAPMAGLAAALDPGPVLLPAPESVELFESLHQAKKKHSIVSGNEHFFSSPK